MIHNGIEYGDMQLIAETYHIMLSIGMNNDQISAVFKKWNSGKLKSYLIEITAKIFQKKEKRRRWNKTRAKYREKSSG